VGELTAAEVAAALVAGVAVAERMRSENLIVAAGLRLRGSFLAAGPRPGLAGGGPDAAH
jgi:hypothetical protein